MDVVDRYRFRGSDDDLRSRFEEYICAALSSLKYADFLSKGQAQDISILGVGKAVLRIRWGKCTERYQRVTRISCNHSPSIGWRLSRPLQRMRHGTIARTRCCSISANLGWSLVYREAELTIPDIRVMAKLRLSLTLACG